MAEESKRANRCPRADRVAELASIVERLERVMRPEQIPVWLSKPIEALDDESPWSSFGGKYRRVAALSSELEDPGAVQPLALDVDPTTVRGPWVRHGPALRLRYQQVGEQLWAEG